MLKKQNHRIVNLLENIYQGRVENFLSECCIHSTTFHQLMKVWNKEDFTRLSTNLEFHLLSTLKNTLMETETLKMSVWPIPLKCMYQYQKACLHKHKTSCTVHSESFVWKTPRLGKFLWLSPKITSNLRGLTWVAFIQNSMSVLYDVNRSLSEMPSGLWPL